MKKLIVFLLTLLLAVVIMTRGIPGYLDPVIDTGNRENNVPLYQNKLPFEPRMEPVYTDEMEPEVKAAITQGLADFKDEIDLRLYGITVSGIKELYTDIVNANPRWFYIESKYTCMTRNDLVVALCPEYSMTEREYLQKKAEFDAEIDKALSVIPDSAFDIEKVLAASDYIALTTAYDESESKLYGIRFVCGKDGSLQGLQHGVRHTHGQSGDREPDCVQ